MIEKNSIGLTIYTLENIFTRQKGEKFLHCLFSIGKRFSPQMYDKGGWIKINNPNDKLLLEYWQENENLLFQRLGQYNAEIAVNKIAPINGATNIVNIWIDEDYFKTKENIKEYLEFCKCVFLVTNPVYGYIHQSLDAINMGTFIHEIYGKTLRPINLKIGLPDIYWGNYFGQKYIQLFGEEKIIDAPCHAIDVYENGGKLVRISESPLDPNYENNRKKQMMLKKYLGLEYFVS